MSVRPLFETDAQRERERLVALRVGRLWSCEAVRNKRAFAADFSMVRGKRVVALAEAKDRSDRYSMAKLDSFGGVMVSLHKWATIWTLAHVGRVPAVLLVQTTDGLWYHSASKHFTHDGLQIGGREDRGDWQDKEPCALFRAKRFRLVTERPPLPLFAAPPPGDVP